MQEGLGLLEQAICDNAQVFLDRFTNDRITQVKVVPAVIEDPQWREKASAWLQGTGVTNHLCGADPRERRCRRVVIREFELKQLAQLLEHLERRHEERFAPVVKSASRSRISSTQRI